MVAQGIRQAKSAADNANPKDYKAMLELVLPGVLGALLGYSMSDKDEKFRNAILMGILAGSAIPFYRMIRDLSREGAEAPKPPPAEQPTEGGKTSWLPDLDLGGLATGAVGGMAAGAAGLRPKGWSRLSGGALGGLVGASTGALIDQIL